MIDRQFGEGIVTKQHPAARGPSPRAWRRRLAVVLGIVILAGCAQRQGAGDDQRHDGFYGGAEFGRSSGGDGGAGGM